MKKTLLALAAITASTAAFAQSSVTLYGVVDASLESVRGDKTVTRVSSDNLASSRLGFKGTEDLGGGTKANFVLETPIGVDVGSAGTGNFWARAAWVGLSGGFGDLRIGRMDTPIGEIAGGSILSAQAYDDLKILKTRGGDSYRRASNAITYFLPTLVPGLSISMQYTTAGGVGRADESSADDAGKTFGMAVKYAAGPLSAGLGMVSAKDEVSGTAGNQSANATLVYAGYDFGAAKVTAYYDAETVPTAFIGASRRMSVAGAKVAVPFSPEFTLVAGFSTARNTEGRATGDDNVHITTIKGIYNLSKRTAVYGMLTNVNNGTATNFNPGVTGTTVSDDRTTRGIAVGVRHSF